MNLQIGPELILRQATHHVRQGLALHRLRDLGRIAKVEKADDLLNI
jgi:hypothetical protein